MADLEGLDLIAPADSLYAGGVKINLIRARLDGLYTILSGITAAEATQVGNMGTTTISAAQWVYFGALDQSIISTASVDFAEVDITKSTSTAAGGYGLRCQVTHSTTGMTGTLRGAYIVATNAPFTATGVIRGAEIKARAATSGDVGGNVTTLEGVSISSDVKNKTVTTQRGMEVILDGKSGAAVTTGVGIRIANNYQADIATTSYALQIYRDSFDYTADIQLSGGGLIGGSNGKIKMTSSGVTTLTAAGNLDIGAYSFRAQTLIADVTTGTAPLTVTSTTKVSNLNVERVDGAHASATPTASYIVIADAAGFLHTPSAAPDANYEVANKKYVDDTVPNTITIADESADTTCFVGYFTGATGALQPKTGTNLTFNSNTGILTATGFAGALTGNVTGNCSGSAGTVATITGLAPDTATTQAIQAAITSCANLATVGTITSGTLSTGAVLADVTMTLGSDADGDIYYRASNKLTRLAKGTATHVLTMGAAIPEWAAASGAGANTALSNLASVAINLSLTSDADITDDLGTAAIRWKDIYAATIGTGDTAADTLLLRARDVDGSAWTNFITLTAGNTPTCAISGAAIDNCIIGAGTPAALTCTTFTSTGIDDNADANALTISVDEVVSVGAAKLTVGATTPTAAQWAWLGGYATTANASAYRNGTQENLGSGTWTKVELNAETYDVGGDFDSTTNYRFVAPVAGYYLVIGSVNFTSVVADKLYAVSIYTDGTIARGVQQQAATTLDVAILVSGIFSLGATGYVELWAQSNAAVDTVDIVGQNTWTYMDVYFLSPA